MEQKSIRRIMKQLSKVYPYDFISIDITFNRFPEEKKTHRVFNLYVKSVANERYKNLSSLKRAVGKLLKEA